MGEHMKAELYESDHLNVALITLYVWIFTEKAAEQWRKTLQG